MTPQQHDASLRTEPKAVEISVIIPSIGRPEVVRAVRSALDQQPVPEVIVVDDSGQDRALHMLEAAPDLREHRAAGRLRVLATGGGALAAGARTLGMGAAHGRFLAFLDDDDLHLPGHLARAHAHLSSVPAPAIYASRELQRAGSGGRIQPAQLLQDGTVDGYLYADAAWRTRSRLLSMSTLVVTADLADVPMVHREEWAEDTDWLLTVSARGARLHVDAFIGAVREGTEATGRDSDRQASRDREAWMEELERLSSPRRVASMLVGREGREAVRRGDAAEVLRLYRRSRELDPDPRWLVPTGLHLLAAAGRNGGRHLRGLLRRG